MIQLSLFSGNGDFMDVKLYPHLSYQAEKYEQHRLTGSRQYFSLTSAIHRGTPHSDVKYPLTRVITQLKRLLAFHCRYPKFMLQR